MWLLIFWLVGFTVAFGQDRGPVRVGVSPTQTRLSLDRVIEMALENNLDIEMEKSNTAAAVQALRSARGVYDPRFRWLATLESQSAPGTSVLQATGGRVGERLHSENVSLAQKLPWAGTSLELGFENSRQSSTNPFLSLSPFTTSRLAFTFTQPLWRGRAIDRERAQIQIRRKQLDLSATQVELKIIETITGAQQAYWDLRAARQDSEVKADAVEWAREQLARIQRMVGAGSLASVEIVAAEAELERRLDTWYASIGTITEAENALKAMLTDGRNAPLWNEEIIPVDESTIAPPQSDDLRNTVTQALKSRPELRALSVQQEANQIQKRQNADLVKPQVNLVASYGTTGLAGATRSGEDPFTAANTALYERVNRLSAQQGLPPLPPVQFGNLPEALIGGYGATLSNMFGGRYQGFQAGLVFDFTPRNNQAKADLAQSTIEERRLRLEQARVEQLIEAEVRNAIQAIWTARQRIAAAEASVRAAQEKLESEIRLFETGESTNFLVLTRQNEYADSRHRLLVANLDMNKAVVHLEKALGTTLEDHNIALK